MCRLDEHSGKLLHDRAREEHGLAVIKLLDLGSDRLFHADVAMADAGDRGASGCIDHFLSIFQGYVEPGSGDCLRGVVANITV